jgi:hypothetical protein
VAFKEHRASVQNAGEHVIETDHVTTFTSCCGREPYRLDLFHSVVEAELHGAGKVVMRACQIFMSLAIAAGCGITLQSSAFSQEDRGTGDQQMACTPDVWRLCGAEIPDVARIVACLRRNTAQLSRPCRAVFQQRDNAPRRDEDGEYRKGRSHPDYSPNRHDRGYGPRRYDEDDE